MRIGIVSFWFERGAAYVSRQYRDVLEKAGHTVFVFARGGEQYAKGNPLWDSPNIHWARKTLWSDSSGIDPTDFQHWLRETGVSMVLFNEQRTLWPVSLCNSLGILTIAYIDYYTKDTVPTFSIYDALLCNTHRHYSVFSWHPQCLFIPWGTDTVLFHPTEPWPELNTPGQVTFFLSSGYSPTRKGADFAIRAFSKVRSPAKLVVHAQKEILRDLPQLAPLLKQEIARGRLEIIHDTIPAPGAYGLGDVYVYPSRLDGIGLTVCEALSCGLPVIVPDEPPMNEFVDEGGGWGARIPVVGHSPRSDGYYWPMCELDVNNLAETMELIAAHSEFLPEMKQRARKHAVSHRTWERNAEMLSSYVEQIAPKHDVNVSHRFRYRSLERFLRDMKHNVRMKLLPSP